MRAAGVLAVALLSAGAAYGQECPAGQVFDVDLGRCRPRPGPAVDRAPRPAGPSAEQREHEALQRRRICDDEARAARLSCNRQSCDEELHLHLDRCRAELYASLPRSRAELMQAREELGTAVDGALERARVAAAQALDLQHRCEALLGPSLGRDAAARCGAAAEEARRAAARAAAAETHHRAFKIAPSAEEARRAAGRIEAATAEAEQARARAEAAHGLVSARAGARGAVLERAAIAAGRAEARAAAAERAVEEAAGLAQAMPPETGVQARLSAERAAADAESAAGIANAALAAIRSARAAQGAAIALRAQAIAVERNRSQAWAAETATARRDRATDEVASSSGQWLRGSRWYHAGLVSFLWQTDRDGNTGWAAGTLDLRLRIVSPLFVELGPLLVGNGLAEPFGIAAGASVAVGVYGISLPVPRHPVIVDAREHEIGSVVSLLNPHVALRAIGYLTDTQDEPEERLAIAIELGNTITLGKVSLSGSFLIGLGGISTGFLLSAGYVLLEHGVHRGVERAANEDAGRDWEEVLVGAYEAGQIVRGEALEVRSTGGAGPAVVRLESPRGVGPDGAVLEEGPEALRCEKYTGTLATDAAEGRRGRLWLCVTDRAETRRAVVRFQVEGSDEVGVRILGLPTDGRRLPWPEQ